MISSLHIQMEVVGCPTICQHCWAQGTPYAALPLAVIRDVLDEAAAFCAGENIQFSAFPMHEVAAHPDAPAVMALFQALVGEEPIFEPFSTTGVPLATRPDWATLLTACRALGTTTVWLAVHGVEEVHDQAVHRAGAYAETLLAAARATSVGMLVGCNVFLTTANVGQFERMVADLKAHGVVEMSLEPAAYYPTARGRRSAALRPTLQDLRPIAASAHDHSTSFKEQWSALENYSEAAYVQAALSGAWQDDPLQIEPYLDLVCRPNLDLFTGINGQYGLRHGNLRHDGVVATLRRAIATNPQAYDHHWFALDPLPTVQELAARYGNPQGQEVHFSTTSMRYRWLDLAQQRLEQ